MPLQVQHIMTRTLFPPKWTPHLTWDHLISHSRQHTPSLMTTTRSLKAPTLSHTLSPRKLWVPLLNVATSNRFIYTCLHALSVSYVSPDATWDPLRQKTSCFTLLKSKKKVSGIFETKSNLGFGYFLLDLPSQYLDWILIN